MWENTDQNNFEYEHRIFTQCYSTSYLLKEFLKEYLIPQSIEYGLMGNNEFALTEFKHFFLF